MLSDNFIAAVCPDGILVVDPAAIVSDLNPAAETLFGWSRADLIGQSVDVLMPADRRGSYRSFLEQFLAESDSAAHVTAWSDLEALCRSGRLLPVSIWMARQDVGGLPYTMVFIRDRSEVAAKEDRVAQVSSELSRTKEDTELLALAAKHANDSIIITDKYGVAIWANPATETLTGYKPGEIIGRRPAELFAGPETDKDTPQMLVEAGFHGQMIRRETIYYNKEGRKAWVELVLSPILDEAGQVQRVVGVTRNISLVKRRTEELEEAKHAAERAEQRLASAIAAIPDAFSVFDEEDRLVMGNEAFFNLPQFSEILALGKTFEEIMRDAVARGIYDLQGADPEGWIRQQLELREKGLNGETVVGLRKGRWLMRRERRTPQGEIVGLRFDITAMKQREAALKEAREEAEAANRAKTEFIANVSHELRTPINSIMGFNQLLLDSGLELQQGEFARLIKASSEHLLNLVDNILEMAKVVGNCIELSDEPFRLASLLRETLSLLSPMAAAKGIALNAQIDIPETTMVTGDSARVRQILLNILGNAVKFTARGGVTLVANDGPAGFLIEVHDTGPGIPADKHQAIFERFERVRTGGGQPEGTGLGLAITKSLIELMRGEVSVRSELGRGSTFTIRLPLHWLAGELHAPEAAAAAQEPSDTSTRYDVIVAEDHPLNQVLIRNVLAKAGCEITIVENGRELLDRLDEADFDLVILDNQMPVMSGIEAAQAIRARDDWKMRIPIVAMTADAMSDAEQTYEQIGVDAFITKPIQVTHVIETVRRLAKNGRARRMSCG